MYLTVILSKEGKMDAKTLYEVKCIIIEEVKDRPMIYDKANKDYSQTIKCMRCFEKIAAIINRDDVDGEFYSLHHIINITVDL